MPPYTTLLYYPPSWKEGGQGDGERTRKRERAALWQGSGGVPQPTSPEGIAPSGRSGGCPSRALLIFPLPERKGARGMVSAPIEARPRKQESRGRPPRRAAPAPDCFVALLLAMTACPRPTMTRGSTSRSPRRPLAGVWGCPPDHKGRPEGIAPSGRRSGGCPSRALLIFPLPERKGARGMVCAPIEARPRKQESRGRRPTTRGPRPRLLRRPTPRNDSLPAAHQGARLPKQESRGRRPLAGVWGCPPAHKGGVSLQSFTNLPPSRKEGGQGDGERTH